MREKEAKHDSIVASLRDERDESRTFVKGIEKGLETHEPEDGVTEPLNPEVAIARYGKQLSLYELKEILEYPEVYYVGASVEKLEADMSEGAVNYGFDDDKQHYLISKHDHIAYRYKYMRQAGTGTFGNALECLDCKTGELCVVKVVRNESQCRHQSDVELRTLGVIANNDPDSDAPVVKMHESFEFRGHTCLVFEMLDRSVSDLLESPRGRQGLPITVVRPLMRACLEALDFLHGIGVIHCDLKPENLLLELEDPFKLKARLKVIDFNTSTTVDSDFFLYIQTRFYRSPEVILGAYYGTGIDIWSFGACLVEMLTGQPLFAGEDEADMLACMMEVCGPPAPALFDSATQSHNYFTEDGDFRGSRRCHAHSESESDPHPHPHPHPHPDSGWKEQEASGLSASSLPSTF